jgi:hypothetical protein
LAVPHVVSNSVRELPHKNPAPNDESGAVVVAVENSGVTVVVSGRKNLSSSTSIGMLGAHSTLAAQSHTLPL